MNLKLSGKKSSDFEILVHNKWDQLIKIIIIIDTGKETKTELIIN